MDDVFGDVSLFLTDGDLDEYANRASAPFLSVHAEEPVPAKRAPRWMVDELQLRQLEEVFKQVKTPSPALRQALAQQMGVTPKQIQVWFRNRRQRERIHLGKQLREDGGECTIAVEAVGVEQEDDDAGSVISSAFSSASGSLASATHNANLALANSRSTHCLPGDPAVADEGSLSLGCMPPQLGRSSSLGSIVSTAYTSTAAPDLDGQHFGDGRPPGSFKRPAGLMDSPVHAPAARAASAADGGRPAQLQRMMHELERNVRGGATHTPSAAPPAHSALRTPHATFSSLIKPLLHRACNRCAMRRHGPSSTTRRRPCPSASPGPSPRP